MSAAGAGSYVAGSADAASNADAQRGRQELAVAMDGAIKYLEDKEAKLIPGLVGARRIAHVACSNCGSACDIHQSQSTTGELWLPDMRASLSVFGWTEDGGRHFCGKTCAERYAAKMRDHGNQPLPVLKVNDRSYAQKMYAEPPKQETTPARPPVASGPAKAQPQARR